MWKRNSLVVFILFLLCISCLQLSLAEEENNGNYSRAGLDYDMFMLDPIGDVKLASTNEILTPVSGFEHIDIVQAQSYQPLNDLGLVSQLEISFEITVSGLITDGNDIIYLFIISADDEDYLVSYNNGNCEGMSTTDLLAPPFSPPPEAVGAGTDTLTVTVNLKNLGNPRELFDWSPLGSVIGEDANSNQYLDKAPDKIVKVTKPTNQGTVHSTVLIEGIVENTITTIETVEYQVNTKNSGGWQPADSTYEDWSEWSFSWDTTRVTDESVHEIHIRGYDGERYLEDTITLYVVQSNKDNPERIVDPPEVNVGDRFDFVSTHDPEYMGIQLEMVTDLTETVVGYENITIDGIEYDVWRREDTGEGEITYANIPLQFELEGYNLYTRDSHSLVKVNQNVKMSIPLIGTSEAETTIEYDPPMDSFDFPMIIGEYWTQTCETRTTTEVLFSGDYATETSENETEYYFEALHVELTEVPAGEFLTFVIREQQKDSDMYLLLYYSPELSNYVRQETYDNNNEMIERIDLIDFDKGTGSYLDIIEVYIDPEEPRVDDKVKIIVKMKNRGTVNITDEELILEINGQEYRTETVNLNSLQEKQIVFHWTPKKEGAYTLVIISPDDEWDLDITVSKAETTDLFSVLKSNLFLILALIIIIIIVVAVIAVKRKRKKRVEDTIEPRAEPTVYGVTMSGEQKEGAGRSSTMPSRTGSAGEPRVIRYSSGLSQVTTRQDTAIKQTAVQQERNKKQM